MRQVHHPSTPSLLHHPQRDLRLPFVTKAPRLGFRSIEAGDETNELFTMEDALGDFTRLKSQMQPRDRVVDINKLAVTFPEGVATVQRITAHNQKSERIEFTQNGWRMFAESIFTDAAGNPISQARKLIQDLARRGTEGEKLATLLGCKYARMAGPKPRLLRTALINGKRVIRSVHSPQYAIYDCLGFVQDLLDIMGNMRVISYNIGDSGMVVRMTPSLDPIDLDKPVAIYQARNSEIGRSRPWLEGGIWKLICTNGLGSWAEGKKSFGWIHRGDPDRIRQGISDAIHIIQNQNTGLLKDYDSALNIMIDDAYAFLTRQLSGEVSAEVLTQIHKGMKDSTSSTYGSLASIVDGITLIAQNNTMDALQQWEMERLAADKIMVPGLRMGRANNNRIKVGVA